MTLEEWKSKFTHHCAIKPKPSYKWISVLDELPYYMHDEKYCLPTKVIIFDKKHKIVRDVDYWEKGFTQKIVHMSMGNNPKHFAYGEYIEYKDVSHWMYQEKIEEPK